VKGKTRLLSAEASLAKVGQTIAGEECISKRSSLVDGPPAVARGLSHHWVEVSTEGNGTQIKVSQTPERDLWDKIGRLRGGGSTRRESLIRAAKNTNPCTDPVVPAPINRVHFDIPQLVNQKVIVADSTISGAGKGLFTTKAVKAGTRLCMYEGERLTRASLPIPNSDNYYRWVQEDIIRSFC